MRCALCTIVFALLLCCSVLCALSLCCSVALLLSCFVALLLCAVIAKGSCDFHYCLVARLSSSSHSIPSVASPSLLHPFPRLVAQSVGEVDIVPPPARSHQPLTTPRGFEFSTDKRIELHHQQVLPDCHSSVRVSFAAVHLLSPLPYTESTFLLCRSFGIIHHTRNATHR